MPENIQGVKERLMGRFQEAVQDLYTEGFAWPSPVHKTVLPDEPASLDYAAESLFGGDPDGLFQRDIRRLTAALHAAQEQGERAKRDLAEMQEEWAEAEEEVRRSTRQLEDKKRRAEADLQEARSLRLLAEERVKVLEREAERMVERERESTLLRERLRQKEEAAVLLAARVKSLEAILSEKNAALEKAGASPSIGLAENISARLEQLKSEVAEKELALRNKEKEASSFAEELHRLVDREKAPDYVLMKENLRRLGEQNKELLTRLQGFLEPDPSRKPGLPPPLRDPAEGNQNA